MSRNWRLTNYQFVVPIVTFSGTLNRIFFSVSVSVSVSASVSV